MVASRQLNKCVSVKVSVRTKKSDALAPARALTLFVVPSGLEPGRPLRNCPVGNFREERDCRGGLLIQKNTRI